jgi:mycothiol synthase
VSLALQPPEGREGFPIVLSIESVDDANAQRLVQYCVERGPEHDTSFLPGHGFSASPEEPAYLLLKDRQVVGAVALLRTPRYLSAGRGRFAIFHSMLDSTEAYTRLFEAIQPHLRDLRRVYLFIPETKRSTAAILTHLGFGIERYSYALINREPGRQEFRLPEGFRISPLGPDDQEGIDQFARCVNECFAELAGHTDLPPAEVRSWFSDAAYLEEGICLLRVSGQAIGTVSITREYGNESGAEVSGLGIVSPFRGRGLGRMLLRYAGAFALRRGFRTVVLSVHAENESALGLYRSEGYELIDTVVCYALDCA